MIIKNNKFIPLKEKNNIDLIFKKTVVLKN